MALTNALRSRREGLGPAPGQPYPRPSPGQSLRRGKPNARVGSGDQGLQAPKVLLSEHRIRGAFGIKAGKGGVSHGTS